MADVGSSLRTAAGPILPQVCLTLGVTGHRPARPGSENLADLEGAVCRLINALSDALKKVGQKHANAFCSGALCLRLVSQRALTP
jgi:hypothetical protein